MEPYVTATASTSTATPTATATAVPVGEPYVTSSSKKPKSSKKSKKPKSIRKKKKIKDSKNDGDDSLRTVYDNIPNEHIVLKASGWNQVTAREINSNAYSNASPENNNQHKYAITGKESQIVTIQLEPNEVCQGEPGSMMYLSSGVAMHASCGSDCFGRCCGGESCCVVNFTNNGGGLYDGTNTARYAALVPNEPLAKVIPVDMSSKEVNGTLIVQPGAYIASFGDVRIGYSCDCNIIRCCCGGMGLVRQKIEGTGTAFLGATGTIVQKVLEENEIMLMDTNCILAYADTCTFDLKRAGGLVGMIGGGEGIFNSSLKGPGLVIVQSMNMKVMLECLAAEKMYRR